MTTPSARPPTAQEAVLAALRAAIVSGDLPPGKQVRQEALAERFGVSRVPLREALKILEGEGSVTYVPRRGYFVADLSLADLLEVYRIRELLEAEAVRVGLPLLVEDDIERFAVAVADCESAGRAADLVAMTDANRRLHFLLYAAAGMPRLERQIRILWDATDVYRSVYYRDGANRATVEAEHRAILAAVRAGDSERVVALLDEHRDHAVAHIRDLVSADRGTTVDRKDAISAPRTRPVPGSATRGRRAAAG
jgi:DNA-binding GntR family transcriptional regulator